jgi:hypothetical protein
MGAYGLQAGTPQAQSTLSNTGTITNSAGNGFPSVADSHQGTAPGAVSPPSGIVRQTICYGANNTNCFDMGWYNPAPNPGDPGYTGPSQGTVPGSISRTLPTVSDMGSRSLIDPTLYKDYGYFGLTPQSGGVSADTGVIQQPLPATQINGQPIQSSQQGNGNQTLGSNNTNPAAPAVQQTTPSNASSDNCPWQYRDPTTGSCGYTPKQIQALQARYPQSWTGYVCTDVNPFTGRCSTKVPMYPGAF